MNMHLSAYMFVICEQNFILFRAMMSLKNLGSFQGHHVRLIGYICLFPPFMRSWCVFVRCG